MKKSVVKTKIRKTKEWQELRKKIFERQNGICPFCGNKLFKGYNIHHKEDRLDTYGNFSNLNNFVALHKDCHRILESLHRKRNLPFELKMIVDKFFSTY
jgi:5-methylcytosine-specific restriction endonuclease McrA